MKKSSWRYEFKLGPWHEIVGNRRLSDWDRLLQRADENHVLGFFALAGGIALLILIGSLLDI